MSFRNTSICFKTGVGESLLEPRTFSILFMTEYIREYYYDKPSDNPSDLLFFSFLDEPSQSIPKFVVFYKQDLHVHTHFPTCLIPSFQGSPVRVRLSCRIPFHTIQTPCSHSTVFRKLGHVQIVHPLPTLVTKKTSPFAVLIQCPPPT